MSLDLLPNHATTLEKELVNSTDSISRLGAGLERIRDAKRQNIPDNVVDWLIYEYGLGEVTPYLTDPRQALAEGVQWQRVRGTPSAVELGLGWINFPASVEESEAATLRWAEYQLGLEDGPADHSKISRVVGISGISQPARTRMFRIHGGWYDFRRFNLNDHALSEGAMLCDHSGVIVRPEWPQLSFGREYQNQADANGAAETAPGIVDAYKPTRPIQSFPGDTFRLSIGFLSDDDWHTPNHPGVAGRLFSFTSLDGLQSTQEILPELSFAKAQIVLSDSEPLGDTNATFAAYEEIESGELIFLSDQALSETPLELIRQEITERFDVLHSKASDPVAVAVSSDYEHARAYHQFLNDTFVLGRSFLGDVAPTQAQAFNNITLHGKSATYAARVWGAHKWPTISWDAPELDTTPAELTPFSFCLGQIILSEQGELGDTNACFPSAYQEEQGDGIFELSGDALSETVQKLVNVEVLERIDRSTKGSAQIPGGSAAYSAITTDFETSSAHQVFVVDTLILGRDKLDDIELSRAIGGFAQSNERTIAFNDPHTATVQNRDVLRAASAFGVTPQTQPTTAYNTRTHGAIDANVQTDQADSSERNNTSTASGATASQQRSPGQERTVSTGFTYAGLTANGSIDGRYTHSSVYLAANQIGAIAAPISVGTASFPDSGQTWTTAAWPPTSWVETQVIVGSTHITT